MRALRVVVDGPGRDQIVGVGEVSEQRLVQELVAQAAVEAFDKGILDRLSGSNVVPLHLRLAGPV